MAGGHTAVVEAFRSTDSSSGQQGQQGVSGAPSMYSSKHPLEHRCCQGLVCLSSWGERRSV